MAQEYVASGHSGAKCHSDEIMITLTAYNVEICHILVSVDVGAGFYPGGGAVKGLILCVLMNPTVLISY